MEAYLCLLGDKGSSPLPALPKQIPRMFGVNGDKGMSNQRGFTLTEVMVVVLITTALLTISTMAIRTYSHHQQIEGAQRAMVSQLRQLQERALAVSNPSIFGAWFRAGEDSDWGPVEYVPDDITTPANEQDCLQRGERGFDTGPFDSGDVQIDAVEFTDGPTVALGVTLADFCLAQIGVAADDLAFFFPKGDATGGGFTISHTRVDDARTIQVLPITGRVIEPEDE